MSVCWTRGRDEEAGKMVGCGGGEGEEVAGFESGEREGQ